MHPGGSGTCWVCHRGQAGARRAASSEHGPRDPYSKCPTRTWSDPAGSSTRSPSLPSSQPEGRTSSTPRTNMRSTRRFGGGGVRWVKTEQLHAGIVGDARGLDGRGVVVGDVREDLRDARAAGVRGGLLEDRHQVVRLGLVHEHVGAPGHLRDGRVECRVAAHHDGAAQVVEAVAEGRCHRAVVHEEGGDHEAVLLEHHRLALRFAARAEGHGVRLHGPRFRGHDRDAVVRGAEALVLGVGVREASHHALDARRTEDAQRRRPPRHPGLQVELAEIADVVRVEVGEQHGADVLSGARARGRGGSTTRGRCPPRRSGRRRTRRCRGARASGGRAARRCRRGARAARPSRRAASGAADTRRAATRRIKASWSAGMRSRPAAAPASTRITAAITRIQRRIVPPAAAQRDG